MGNLDKIINTFLPYLAC